MYCSQCGAQASGKFCWSCGRPLASSGAEQQAVDEVALVEIPWTELTNYQSLIRMPEVRDRLARHAARSKEKLTGEEFLEACDQVFKPLTGGVPIVLIAKIAQPIGEKLGLRTGKTRCERLAEPPGKVIVEVLCSLAQHGQKVTDVVQLATGCTLQAAIPSDLWALKGDLIATIRAQGKTTLVEAGLTIRGQAFDWGKSRRCLDRLFGDLRGLTKCA